MMYRPQLRLRNAHTLTAGALIACLAQPMMSTAAGDLIDVAAAKDNILTTDGGGSVNRSFQNTAEDFPALFIRSSASLTEKAILAFDVSPYQGRITSVEFQLTDLRPSRATTVNVFLLDVEADWDESTITWNNSAAYGNDSASNGFLSEVSTALGQISLDQNPPGTYSVGALVGDQTFIDALNNDDDGLIVLGVNSDLATVSFVSSRESTNAALPGPTLSLTVVPEPSAILILAAAGLATAGRRRSRSDLSAS